MKHAQETSRYNSPYPHDSFCDLQKLIDRAAERILNKIPHSYSGEGLPRICVEHCREAGNRGEVMGDLRYLKVYAEGHGLSIVMLY